jgi:Flp pilus assembly protein TadG
MLQRTGHRLARRIAALRDDERGAATIEFALWSALFFAIVIVALDFGMYRIYQMRLGSAVEQGAMLSFNDRTNFGQTSFATIQTYMRSAAALPGPNTMTATATCNSLSANCVTKAAGRTCVCISGAAPTFSAPQACGSPCAVGGSTAGYYAVLSAQYTYTPAVIPTSWLSNRIMSERAVVRLQ